VVSRSSGSTACRRRRRIRSARLKTSRSKLYSDAIAEYVARHDPDLIVEKLNETWAATGAGTAFVTGAGGVAGYAVTTTVDPAKEFTPTGAVAAFGLSYIISGTAQAIESQVVNRVLPEAATETEYLLRSLAVGAAVDIASGATISPALDPGSLAPSPYIPSVGGDVFLTEF
jgi:hypothetical protein